ncbi:MAG: hypothetical protein Q4615_14130 [Paracoccus aminovorans]|nr:hypothetical protein [Paracoccus aminovorans]
MSDDATNVTLTKMCLKHGIAMPRDGALASRFQAAFPAAHYDDEAGEWRMEWKKGSFAESNARLEAFFADSGVGVTQVDKC